jgi:hypothetical protein
MAKFLTAALQTSKNGRVTYDDAKNQMGVFNAGDEQVSKVGDLGNSEYGIKVEIGGVSVGLTTVASNISQTITVTATPRTGSTPIVSSWDDTFYKDSVSSGNEYEAFTQGGGYAWNGLTKSQYDVNIFNSWGLTNNINVKHVAMFKNRSASSVDTLYRGQMRVISIGSSAA